MFPPVVESTSSSGDYANCVRVYSGSVIDTPAADCGGVDGGSVDEVTERVNRRLAERHAERTLEVLDMFTHPNLYSVFIISTGIQHHQLYTF